LNILLTALHPVGGIRTYFRYVYSEPVFKDVNITLLAPDEGLADFLDKYLPDHRITLIPMYNKKGFLFTMNKLLKSGDFDIVHSHGFSAGIFTYLSLLFRKEIHLMTAHDVFTDHQFKGWKGYLKKKVMNFIFSKINYIHTVTHDANQNLLDFCPSINPSNLRFIAHGIDSERFSSAETRNLKSELSLDNKQFLVGFFGRFMGQKGFRILVKSIKKIKDENLLSVIPKVVTFGWGGFIREDYQYIEELGLSDYFIQMPNTNDMPAAIKGVDVVAMPSRWEACGLLGMEVLCCGTPLVATNCIGLREVVENSPAISINVDDSEALAHALVESLTSQQKEKSSLYMAQAAERFSVTDSALGMKDLYIELYQKSALVK